MLFRGSVSPYISGQTWTQVGCVIARLLRDTADAKGATVAKKAKDNEKRDRRAFGRIRQFKSGRYQASYTGPDGKVHIAPHTYAAKIDAEGWLADRRREIDRDLWSAPATAVEKKQKKQNDLTFGEYAKTWLDTRQVKGRPIRPRTREHYQRLLDKHLLPVFGKRPLRSITPEQVDRWYERTAAEAPTLRAHCYSLLRTILETARTGRTRLIDSNPCMIAGAGTTNRKIKPKPATPAELDVLVAAMPDRLQLMTLLASWCALRFGELVELRTKDIDLGGNAVNVTRAAVRVGDGWTVGDPKSDAGVRSVSIPPHVRVAIKHHLAKYMSADPEQLLFPPKDGEHLQPSTLYRHHYRARKAAGRPDLRFHDLRHTGAVYAAMAGATLAELMDRLGHSTVQAAMRYQHAASGRDQTIAEAMSKLA